RLLRGLQHRPRELSLARSVEQRRPGQAISHDREQPQDKRALRIVRGTDGMEREQNILHKIFNVHCIHKSSLSPYDLAYSRCDFVEKLKGGGDVAFLRSLHQLAEVIVRHCRVRHTSLRVPK